MIRRKQPRAREQSSAEPTLPPCAPGRVCCLWVPVRTNSALNERGSTKWRGARDARVRGKVASSIAATFQALRIKPPCTVVLVRASSGLLDSDNLWGSQKKVRDAVADVLRVDDADPSVTWVVDQVKCARGASGVFVEVYEPGSAIRQFSKQSEGWIERMSHSLDVILPLLRRGA